MKGGPEDQRAFTLAELLILAGLLALLAAMAIPVLASTADRTRRARCQNNLRQIAMGVTIYAGNYHGRLFSARAGSVQVALNATDGAAAATVGLSFQTNGVWTCPNRLGLPVYDAPFAQWKIGYQYFGGIATWANPAGNFPSRSPTNLTTARAYWTIAADAVLKVDGQWGGNVQDVIYTNLPQHHADDSTTPQGGNQAFADGSVQWVQAQRMFFLSSWSVSARQAYWYQDTRDFDPALRSMISNLRFQP